MNTDEALMLIHYTGQKWGAAAAVPVDAALLNVRVDVWLDALADIPAGLVRASLAAAGTEFPPNVLQLRRIAEELAGVRPDLPDWDTYWAWVREQASGATRFLLERHPPLECPWPELDGIVTVGMLADWARSELTTSDLDLVAQAHVRRRFEAGADRARREAMTPAPIVAEILAGRGLSLPALPTGDEQ